MCVCAIESVPVAVDGVGLSISITDRGLYDGYDITLSVSSDPFFFYHFPRYRHFLSICFHVACGRALHIIPFGDNLTLVCGTSDLYAE